METPPSILRRNDSFVLVSLIAFLAPVTLFVFRHLDDNKLTSWKWAFAGADLSVFYFTLIIGLIGAFFLSRISCIERNPVISLIIFSFLTSSLFWSEPEVIIDTSRYFTQAKHLSEYGIHTFMKEWGRGLNAWTDLPLLPLLYGLLFKVFGEYRIVIQCFTAFLFAMTAVVTCLTGKALWDESTGFSAGLLLTGIPYLLTQTPLMLVDTATMFTLVFSLFTFIKAIEKGGVWVPLSSFALLTAVFSKYSTWMMLSVLAITFLVYLIQGYRTTPTRIILRAISVLAVAAVPLAAVVFYKFGVIREQIDLLITFQKPGLKGWSESFLSTFFFQTHPFITISAVASLYFALKKRDLRTVIVSWLPLLMVCLWVRRSRYLLPVFPMLTLMAGYGLQMVKEGGLRRYIAYAAVSTSLVISLLVYLPFLKKMSPVNLMHAGRYLDSLDSAAVEVLVPASESSAINPAVSVPVLDLFTEKRIHFVYEEQEPPEGFRTSPLRFSWTYQNPDYYENLSGNDAADKRPLVIITAEHGETLPDALVDRIQGYRKTAEFTATTGIFRYSPDVTIYER